MRHLRVLRTPVLLAVAVLATLTASLITTVPADASPAAGVGSDGSGSSLVGALGTSAAGAVRNDGQITKAAARKALREAELVKSRGMGGSKRFIPGRHVEGRPDATMALTTLWNARSKLSGRDLKTARALLARPSASAVICGSIVCVHYTPGSGGDRASTTYAKQVLAVVTKVNNVYTHSGYRRPAPDKDATPGKVDVYLQDLYDEGYYGYCTPESQVSKTAATAYCVLDNDYATSQYGSTHTPTDNLRVTAAHEYFHAVQFAYDANEDRWLMEATATWAEDEIYTKINDNRQYLPYGQLETPRTPLDKSNASNLGIYGNWIFFRYLSERFRAKQGSLPSIILGIWQRAPKTYSTYAVRQAIAARKSTLKKMYTHFVAANLKPSAAYSEGARYHAAPAAGKVTLKGARRTVKGSYTTKHLTSATEAFVPSKVRKGWHLKVSVDLAQPKVSRAVVSVFHTDGTRSTYYLAVNKKGQGSKRISGFYSKRVRKVTVTLVNTSASFACNQGTVFSCKGQAHPDSLKQIWKAQVYR